jgi:hypothetical protein
MNPIAIILHIGSVIAAVKDMENTIGDLVAKKGVFKDDIKKVLEDFKGLIDSGLITIPNISQAQIDEAISSLETVV